MNNLLISLVQANIAWENKHVNLEIYGNLLKTLSGKTDLIVLPELFTTGFSMRCRNLAETNSDETISTVKDWASSLNCAIAGSFMAKDEHENIYNRGFFVTPEQTVFFYDKRHLFRMGEEHVFFNSGSKQLIIPYKNWNINFIICYDLRFPVWNRNVNNNYDLMICPANWPGIRNSAWETLLKARAIENMSYVCGVNRIGEDGNGLKHIGNSMLICPKGEILSDVSLNETTIKTYTIEKKKLHDFRQKFPTWKDADNFDIKL